MRNPKSDDEISCIIFTGKRMTGDKSNVIVQYENGRQHRLARDNPLYSRLKQEMMHITYSRTY